MSGWTPDRVSKLAPDAASLAAGQALASPKKWTSIGASSDADRTIWGLCQGSGKQPYQARVDLGEPAFKCSCPSRKFPCKHTLALLLLYAKDPKPFKSQAEPSWVSDWMTERVGRAERKAEKAQAAADKPIDEEAQAKRAAKRDDRVQWGARECRVWLDDLARRGLAAARTDPGGDWDRIAARMIDAQAPGLAAAVRRIAGSLASGDGWETRTLDLLGRLHLLLEATDKLAILPAELAIDVRTALGYPQSKDDALAGPTHQDTWTVIGQVHEDEDRLTVRRTWLFGRTTARRALIVDFAAGNQRLEPGLLPGTEFEGEVVFYPSGSPLRALVKNRGDTRPISMLKLESNGTIAANLLAYAQTLATNLWLSRYPFLIEGAKLARESPNSAASDHDRWYLTDAHGSALPLRPGFAAGTQLWKLLSISGGRGITTALEWDGEDALPIAALTIHPTTTLCDLAPRWVA